MIEVFRDSGFEVRSKSARGVVDVTLTLTPSAEGVISAETRRRRATAASLRPMLEPRAVAVIGAWLPVSAFWLRGMLVWDTRLTAATLAVAHQPV